MPKEYYFSFCFKYRIIVQKTKTVSKTVFGTKTENECTKPVEVINCFEDQMKGNFVKINANFIIIIQPISAANNSGNAWIIMIQRLVYGNDDTAFLS